MRLISRLRSSPLYGSGVDHLPGTPILSVSELTVKYEAVPALKEVSFTLQKGERVAVVGPNGAGKSTLFKVIAGVIPPSAGEVNVFGHRPGGHICIAYLPQRNLVDWSFPVTVADVVMMGRVGKLGLFRHPKRSDWQIVRQALAQVGLEGLQKRQIGELSGGQQQRMFIARALAQEAELLMMDEPLSGLDLASQEAIFNILEELRARQVTVMVSTHDLDQAVAHFDRVMLLNRVLLGFGPPQQVFTPERLRIAYGGHLHVFREEGETLAFTDTCCDEGRIEK